MARVVVLVPRRPEPWRDRLWGHVRARIEDAVEWPIHEGVDAGPQPMNRAAARNRAAAEAEEWDVAVFCDADTVPDFERLEEAVGRALDAKHLVCPQDTFRSLTRAGTLAVLDGSCEVHEAPERWDYPNPKSSCIVVHRDAWEAVGGYDERFVGWGFEDAAFYHACEALVGVERLKGLCWHLWHPRSPEKDPNTRDYRRNAELGARYKAASGSADAMRAILAEPGGPLA